VKWLRRLLRRRGYHLTRVSGGELAELDAYERRLAENAAPVSFNEAVSRLVELKKRYEAVTLPIANHSLWSSRAASRPNPRAGWSQGGIEVFRGGGRNSYVGPYGATDPLRARCSYSSSPTRCGSATAPDFLVASVRTAPSGAPPSSFPVSGE